MTYKISIDIMGETYKSSGSSLFSALSKFKLEWQDIKGKGIMTIADDKNSYEHLFNVKVLRRIFANKLTREIWAKNLKTLLESEKSTNIPQ